MGREMYQALRAVTKAVGAHSIRCRKMAHPRHWQGVLCEMVLKVVLKQLADEVLQ